MSKNIAIIGAGPAGLMAAETLAGAGHAVKVYERKPSPGRKFLMAGRGGLNLTHSENIESFIARYGTAAKTLLPMIREFSPQDLRKWCEGLGETTFVGSSGRVFPQSFKATPLLRAWMARLGELDVEFIYQQEWQGWDDQDRLILNEQAVKAGATLLALGGASWPRLGSDGSWAKLLEGKNIKVQHLRPSNCGFEVAWSDIFREKFAGAPVKPVTLSFKSASVEGEAMMTARGIEGGAVYALSSLLREEIAATGHAMLNIDLRPGITCEELEKRLTAPPRALSFANFLRREAGLTPVAVSLLREGDRSPQNLPPGKLATLIKSLPLRLNAPFPIDRAISSAGGIPFEEVNDHLMLKKLPGVFVAGEMLDWEAPTGGYLLQATFSTAVRAAKGIIEYSLHS